MVPGDDWARMMEQLTREQRRAEELLRGPLDYTNALDYARQQQQRYDELARGALGSYDSALNHIRSQQHLNEELTTGSTNTIADPVTLTKNQLVADQVLRSTYFETSSLLPDILGARPLDAAFARVAGLLDARESVRLEELTAGYGARFVDLEKALGPTMPQPTYMAWSEHFQAAIQPILSFQAQEWTRPFGLMLEGPSAMEASIAWRVHRGGPSVHVAAVTPRGETENSPRFSLETEVVCGLCGGPILPFGNVKLTMVGPRRGMLKRPIFPACATCTHEENIPALLAALCELAGPDAPRLEIIRGGGQGDGVRRGDLRLVRTEPAKGDPDTR